MYDPTPDVGSKTRGNEGFYRRAPCPDPTPDVGSGNLRQ